MTITNTLLTIGQLLENVSHETTVVPYTLPHCVGVVLPNKWTVSVAYHSGSYSSYRFRNDSPDDYREIDGTVEIAITRPPFDWYMCPRNDDPGCSQVWGWIDAPVLQRVIDRAAAMPDGPCPCPDCVTNTIKEESLP